MSTLPVRYYTPEEYFAIDEASDARNEYFSGEIVMMAGNTPEHVRIVDNLVRYLGNAFDSRPCQTWSNMLRVKASETTYVYPDISITCGSPNFLSTSPKTLTNPIVVIEVLSSSTQNVDRGEKFVNYLKLEALQHYVLVSQDKPLIEVYTRMPNGHWDFVALSGLEAVLELTTIETAVPLEHIYRNVEFPVRLEISEG
jgi:Uma2 family endonuclease